MVEFLLCFDVLSAPNIILIPKVFSNQEFFRRMSHDLITICPRHRAEYGIRWRTGKTMCSVPSPMIAHKSAKVKGTRRISSQLSSLILKETGQLIVVGSRK